MRTGDATAMPNVASFQTERLERLENSFFGKYRGVVVDNKDPEQLGRLRLMVPSVFGGHDDPTPKEDFVTDWAWPCVPTGGAKGQGFFFIPDEGAKVWVEFEEGNVDCPLWVGTFWVKPTESEIPEKAKQMQNNEPRRRVLQSTSGHMIELCDIGGEETVTVLHKGGAHINFDTKGSITIRTKQGTLIYLNAEEKELLLSDEGGNNVRLGDSSVTLTNKDGSVVDIAGPAVQVIAKNVALRSETVSLGEGAMEPAILGRAFAAVFDAHVHPTAFGPSGPPMPVPMPLSSPMHPAISKAVKVK